MLETLSLLELALIRNALLCRKLSLRDRKRLPRGVSVQHVVDEIISINEIIEKIEIRIRPFGPEESEPIR